MSFKIKKNEMMTEFMKIFFFISTIAFLFVFVVDPIIGWPDDVFSVDCIWYNALIAVCSAVVARIIKKKKLKGPT